MANATNRFCGIVGYVTTDTDDYGVSRQVQTERTYYGDIQKLTTRWQTADKLNDDLNVSHRISILADPYAIQNFPYIKYVEWMGVRWTVQTVEMARPRLILSIGGVYNGEQA